ncbi:MAG: hypothetical protein FWH31_08335 [Streptococcaceae bacterium]|uniref:Uncharacterized protein n=1 Tax=Lactococcus protaetiae TaxID=2592653 RepID=A0A514ZB78_9LACT|nr:hypothetical protein [Streptococcaceae bacterium]QDK71832.1 hypothetical protein FLP15_12445 [Lactococcus protaetiae]
MILPTERVISLEILNVFVPEKTSFEPPKPYIKWTGLYPFDALEDNVTLFTFTVNWPAFGE